jgi:hypothetical protein
MTPSRPPPVRLELVQVQGGPAVAVLATRVVHHLLLRPAWEAASGSHSDRLEGGELAIEGAPRHIGCRPIPSSDEYGRR